jgi:hypothetical protein
MPEAMERREGDEGSPRREDPAPVGGLAFFLPIAAAPAKVHPGMSLDAGVVGRREGGRR